MAILIGAPTPLTVSVDSVNEIDHVAGTINHAVSHSSNPGAAESLLSTDDNGYIRIVRIGLGKTPAEAVDVVGNIQLTGRIKHTNDLIIEPAGNDVLFQDADIQAHNWISGTTGWGIQRDGDADFRNLTADSLTVEAFISDVNLALAGSQFVTKSLGILARPFTIPTTSGTLYVLDLPGYENTAVFENGDYVRLRYVDRSGGGLVVGDAWGTVSSYSDLSGGEQSWTWTRVSGSVGQVISAGMIALDYGQSGDGYVHTTTLDAAGSPYLEVGSWATDPSVGGNHTVHLRIGQLDGISGVGDEWGLWAGQSAYKYLLMSDQNADIHGMRLSLYDGSNLEALRLDPDVPSLAVGQPLPTGPAAGGDGFWTGLDGGSYKLRIGKAAGPALHWTGAAVELHDNAGEAVIVLNSSNSYFAKPMTLGSGGGIWQGTGTFASPATGLKIWNDSGTGRIGAFADSVLQVSLNEDGLSIQSSLAGSNPNSYNTISWANAGASHDARVWVYNTAQVTGLFNEVKGRNSSQGAAWRVDIEDDNADQSLQIDAYAAAAIGGTRLDYTLNSTLVYRLTPSYLWAMQDLWLQTNLVSRKNNVNYDVYPMHYLTTPLTSTAWDNDRKTSSNNGTIDLSAVFGVPAGVKAVLVRTSAQSSTVGNYVAIGPASGTAVAIARVQTANNFADEITVVPCNTNGDVYFTCSGTCNVVLQIWGYAL